MSDFQGNGHYVQCPLCEGKGQMHRSDLEAKLSDSELVSKLAAHVGPQAEASEAGGRAGEKVGTAAAGRSGPTDREREVLNGPWNKLLWRRSPKE